MRKRSPLTRRWATSLVAVLTVGVIPWSHAAEDAPDAKTFLAGAATSNITPPLGEPIVGGFSPFPATNVRDELHARCLVLDDGTTRVGFVLCDNVGVKREIFDAARERIEAELDIPADNVLFASTHTHSATPSTSDRYRDLLVDRIVDGVARALANRVPAKIGWGGIAEPTEVFNRRWYVTDPELRKNPFGGVDEVRMNPPRRNPALREPAGPTDPEISFLSVRAAEDDRPLALLGNYSLHYVGGVRRGEISADYFGIFARRIGELLGAEPGWPPFVGILSNGTSGDINNIDFQGGSGGYGPYEKMTEVAELVAQRVKEAEAKITYHDWVPLASAHREITLDVAKPEPKIAAYVAHIQAMPEDAETKYHRLERIYAKRVQALIDGPDTVDIRLQALRIGDLGIGAIPFEVFAEIGLEIKEKAPFDDAFTIELANGSHGYLPTPRQHQLGGYETWLGTCRVQKDASEIITKVILELMNDVK